MVSIAVKGIVYSIPRPPQHVSYAVQRQENDTANTAALLRAITQSCPNPYCLCTPPLAAPFVMSGGSSYATTIPDEINDYVTIAGAADPCLYTEDPGTRSQIYLVTKTESTFGPPSFMPPLNATSPPERLR